MQHRRSTKNLQNIHSSNENLYQKAPDSDVYILCNTRGIFDYSEGSLKYYSLFGTFLGPFIRNTKKGNLWPFLTKFSKFTDIYTNKLIKIFHNPRSPVCWSRETSIDSGLTMFWRSLIFFQNLSSHLTHQLRVSHQKN